VLAADRFLSRLAIGPSDVSPDTLSDNKWIAAEFVRLVSPSIGRLPSANLAFTYLFEKRPSPDTPDPEGSEGRARRLLKLGYIAAFFLDQYDDDSMNLEKEDWQNIRSILEEASEEIDVNTLTALMGELLERGEM
jgi:hypothetical protein